MRRAILKGLATVLLAAAAASPAHAQYGYGGWGGWGGGGGVTAGGDIARGMGVFAAGVGQMNVMDAQAASINSTTAMRWNDYEWQISQSLYQDYNRRLIQKQQETAKSIKEINDRLRNAPSPSDIQGGRALNAILDDFQNPRVQAEAGKISERKNVSAAIVKRVPFFYSSDPFTFSMSKYLDGNVEVPAILLKEFPDDIKAIKDLVEKARTEDLASEESPVSESTHKALNDATKALRTKFEAKYPKGSADYVRTEPFLKTIVGFTTLLRSNDFEKQLAQLQEDGEISLFNLLSFMTAYNLRFGPAKTPEQRSAYTQLFGIMDERRKQIVSLIADHSLPELPSSHAIAAPAPPTHMFQNLDFDQLDKTTTAPKPFSPGGNR